MTKLCIITRKNRTGFVRGDYTIEDVRLGELEALHESSITPAKLVDADGLWVRTHPERTRLRYLLRLKYLESCKPANATILNPTSSFQNYANKINTYVEWNRAGLKTPTYLELPLFKKYQAYESDLVRISRNGCYLRTSNEDSGKGLKYLPVYDKSRFKQAIKSLRWRALTNKVETKNLMAVAPVNNERDGIAYVYRVHLVGNQIVGGYGICGEQGIIHVRNMRETHLDAFLTANQLLMDKLRQPEFSSQLVKALKALKMHIGAIEFFLIDDEVVFLEVNPVWGGLHTFGDAEFMQKLTNDNLPENIRVWLNPKKFYLGFWEAAAKLIADQGRFDDAAFLAI